MIVEFVQFTYPPVLTREQILEDARTTIPRWRGNKELVRKHYIVGEDGSGGAFYIWPSKEAAQRGHNAEWFANIKARTGSVPTIRYFDLMMIVDNEAGLVTEFPQNMTSEAAAAQIPSSRSLTSDTAFRSRASAARKALLAACAKFPA